jgi:TetR/AcrR family transcriptional regulator, repressor of fatR-cypB operon
MSTSALSTSPDTSARGQVLGSALRLFTEKGYFNTSVQDVVRDSGVSTGSIYHHFKDKEGIAKALYDDLVAHMGTAIADIQKQHQSSQDRCRAVIEHLFQMTEAEPEIMSFMLYAKHREFMPDEAPICSSKPFEQMRDMVKDGMDSGLLVQMDLLVAATAVFGGALRMIHLRLDGILEKPLPAYLDEVWQCAWRSVAK